MLKKIRYFLESIAVRFALFLFRILGLKASIIVARFLTIQIGLRHNVNNLARTNMEKALKISQDDSKKLAVKMWDNLGQIIGEFIYICRLKPKELLSHVKVSAASKKNLANIKKKYNGGIIFSGHLGNWEIGPKFFLANGFKTKTLYRPLNNKVVDDLTAKIRGHELIAKSSKGNKEIISALKKGYFVIILADQKTTDGINVPFFHKKAKTTTSIARLALKYDVPLIPARSIRVGDGFNFEAEVDKPILPQKTVSSEKEIHDLTLKINQKLEKWIKEYPEQWFWVHNRWKK